MENPEWAAAKLAMTNVSRTLGLMEHDQDWGLVNGDGGRLEEFAQFLRDGKFASNVVYELVDLVLSSANERLVQCGTFDQDAVFGAVAAQDPLLREAQIEYWGSLNDTEKAYSAEAAETFPVAPIVRAWFADDA